jgi:hypothetical protein
MAAKLSAVTRWGLQLLAESIFRRKIVELNRSLILYFSMVIWRHASKCSMSFVVANILTRIPAVQNIVGIFYQVLDW